MRIALSLLALCAPALGAPLAPVIDGSFSDWAGAQATTTDPAGDGKNAFDVTGVEAIASGGRLSIRVILTQALGMQSGPGIEGTLRLHVAKASDPDQNFTFDMRGRSVTSDHVAGLDWGVIDFVSAPTIASTSFELSFLLEPLGFELGDELLITTSGSDTLESPLSVTVEKGPIVVRAEQNPAKAPGVLRICSVNTLQNGALDPARAPVLGRLVDGMDADIICLQEEWNSDTGLLSIWASEADPLDDGSKWAAYRVNGNVIIAPQGSNVMIQPGPNDGFTLAIIDTGKTAMIVGAVHLKCCGHAGSSEDQRRISQANGMVAAIKRIRDLEKGDTYFEYRDAPFVLVGDWNLVGSGSARDIVVDDPDLGAIDLAPMRLRGDRNTTWRDLTPSNGGFPPGRLDLAVVSDALGVVRSFVFDTTDLSDETLGDLGLQAGDSSVTDHLMLVIDTQSP